MTWAVQRNSAVLDLLVDYLNTNAGDELVDQYPSIEVEAKFNLFHHDPANTRLDTNSRHLAYQTIMSYSQSAQILTSYTRNIRGGSSTNSRIELDLPRKKSSVYVVTHHNDATIRSRRVDQLLEPYQLNLNGGVVGTTNENIKKIRISDVKVPMAKGSNQFTISIAAEVEVNEVANPTESGTRVSVRYDVTKKLREFLNLVSESTITIDIQYIGGSDIKLEVEAGSTDPYEKFIQDVLTIENYIINYPILNRPEDISRDDLKHSVFFDNGPYRLAMKNNGSRRIMFFDSTIMIMMNSSGQVLDNVLGDWSKLTGMCIDAELWRDGSGVEQLIVLDCSGEGSHSQRMNRLRTQMGSITVRELPLRFKTFITLNTIEEYYTQVPIYIRSIDDNLYDGIVLIPDYRPFVLPYRADPPKIFRYKKYQSIDVNNKILNGVTRDRIGGRNYTFQANMNPVGDEIGEYRIDNVIDNDKDVRVVLTYLRPRPDRSSTNSINTIVSMVNVFREHITVEVLAPMNLSQLITLNPNDFGNPESVVVIGDDRELRAIVERDLGTQQQSNNPTRIILFPDDNSHIDPITPTYIIGHSYLRLLRCIGTWRNITVSLNSPVITVQSQSSTLNYSQDIGNRVTVDSWMSVAPDRMYIDWKYTNSLVAIKLGMSEPVVFENPAQQAQQGVLYTDRYDVMNNRLSDLFWQAGQRVGLSDEGITLRLASLGAEVQDVVLTTTNTSGVTSVVVPAYGGPKWWLPSMSYPIISDIFAIVSMHFLSGMPHDNSANGLLPRMVKYLHPIGMVDFVTLSDGEMEDFLDAIANEYSTYMVGRFLCPFLVLFKVILGCELYTNYRDVFISSGVAVGGTKFWESSFASDPQDEANRLSVINLHTVRTVGQFPGIMLDPYSVHPSRVDTYRANVKKLAEGLPRFLTNPQVGVMNLQNDAYLIHCGAPASVNIDSYCNIGTVAITISIMAARVPEIQPLATQLKAYLAGGVPRAFVFKDVLYPNSGIGQEVPYTSINWTAGNDKAVIPLNIYGLLAQQVPKIVL